MIRIRQLIAIVRTDPVRGILASTAVMIGVQVLSSACTSLMERHTELAEKVAEMRDVQAEGEASRLASYERWEQAEARLKERVEQMGLDLRRDEARLRDVQAELGPALAAAAAQQAPAES